MVMATRKRHSPEQVVRKLATADRLLAEGKDLAGVCGELGVSGATCHWWRNQFGGLHADRCTVWGPPQSRLRLLGHDRTDATPWA